MVRRLLVAMMIVGVFVTIAAIVRPVRHADHHDAQSTMTALFDTDEAPADQPQIQLPGGEINHIPATLMSTDVIRIDFDSAATMHPQSTYGFHYRQASWLKGFTPPP